MVEILQVVQVVSAAKFWDLLKRTQRICTWNPETANQL